ncbi:hypothetical protein AAVH_35263 [Aphelenchoides avenae]|nr:hypothetical protein AAVH_35263 [Aphelenchus avenae]
MFEAELEEVFAKTATHFSEEAALNDFTRLHISLIALLNLSRSTFGGSAKSAFRFTFWCTVSILAPSQYCIPFVIRADKAGERDPWNMVLVLWWYVMGTIVLVLVVNWLIDPLKKIVKLKIKLRQDESLYVYPTKKFHMVVRNMIASIEEAQVRPLSFRKMFFEFPLVTLVLFNLPFFLYVLNLR